MELPFFVEKMNQTPAQRQRLIEKICRRIDRATSAAAATAQANAPIDTSSLATSVVWHPAKVVGNKIVGLYSAGTLDFTGQIMPRTGKLGKDTSQYAIKQEIRTGFFSSGIPVLREEISK